MEFSPKEIRTDRNNEGIVIEIQALCIIVFLMFDVEGRSLMTQPPGVFNKAASKAYKQLTRKRELSWKRRQQKESMPLSTRGI